VVYFLLAFPPITYFSSHPFVPYALPISSSLTSQFSYTWWRVQVMKLLLCSFLQVPVASSVLSILFSDRVHVPPFAPTESHSQNQSCVYSFYFWNACSSRVLYCSVSLYIVCVLTSAIRLVSFQLIILSFLRRIMTYASSCHYNSLWLKF
jgi:hypothetical protein